MDEVLEVDFRENFPPYHHHHTAPSCSQSYLSMHSHIQVPEGGTCVGL